MRRTFIAAATAVAMSISVGLLAIPARAERTAPTPSDGFMSRPLVVRGNQWFFRSSLTSGSAEAVATFATAGTPLLCDLDGNGADDLVSVTGGVWTFWLGGISPGSLTADGSFNYGVASDVPICGDWDGNGFDSAGVHRGIQFLLANSSFAPGVAELIVAFGNGGDVALAGDWDGDGDDSIGVQRGDAWFLRNANAPGSPDLAFAYGIPGDRALVGDWDDDGDETVGIVRSGVWFLRNAAGGGVADVPAFVYGDPGDRVLSFEGFISPPPSRG